MSACNLGRFGMGPYIQCKDCCLVWFDGYKIVGNDCHRVVVHGEMLQASRPAINHPQSMLDKFSKRCSIDFNHPTDDTDTLGPLATEPILVLVTLYMSFCYELLFLFIEGYPVAFQEVRGLPSSLIFLLFRIYMYQKHQ